MRSFNFRWFSHWHFQNKNSATIFHSHFNRSKMQFKSNQFQIVEGVKLNQNQIFKCQFHCSHLIVYLNSIFVPKSFKLIGILKNRFEFLMRKYEIGKVKQNVYRNNESLFEIKKYSSSTQAIDVCLNISHLINGSTVFCRSKFN